jgi:uncharacterized coiled-coil DUF342 family protein
VTHIELTATKTALAAAQAYTEIVKQDIGWMLNDLIENEKMAARLELTLRVTHIELTATKTERDELKTERDELKTERDELKTERDELKTALRGMVTAHGDFQHTFVGIRG